MHGPRAPRMHVSRSRCWARKGAGGSGRWGVCTSAAAGGELSTTTCRKPHLEGRSEAARFMPNEEPPPCCRGGAHRLSRGASNPLARPVARVAHLHARRSRAIHIYIPSPPPCATPAAPDAPRTRISLHSAARHKARRNPPPTFVPRAAPPCRQTMNLDSVVAYSSRTIGCCRATRGYFPFCSSFFRWQMCRVGAAAMSRGGRARRGRPFFFVFLRQ